MLSRNHRFHGINSLNYVYRQGQTIRSGQIALRYAPNDRRQAYRVAVVVSKKVEKSAVKRNRIRRRVYGVLSTMTATERPYDLVFTVFSTQVADMPIAELDRLLHAQLRKAGVEPASAKRSSMV